jgi:predicted kinase
MPRVHVIEGPVGAGKSTFAASVAPATSGVHIALDDWFVRLFSPDRPGGNVVAWYLERKDRLLDLIWDHSRRILGSGRDVILELGLIQRQQRLEFCRRIQANGFDLVLYILDEPRDIRRQRVQLRNAEKGSTFSMVIPDHVFEVASDMWEPPDDIEESEFAIEYVSAKLVPLTPNTSLERTRGR